MEVRINHLDDFEATRLLTSLRKSELVTACEYSYFGLFD